MLFNSWTFAAFLALVLLIYYRLSPRAQNVFLVAASYTFYAFWDWRFLGLLWISTAVDWTVARAIARSAQADPAGGGGRRRRLLYVSLATNLGILGFFKYFGFFVESARGALGQVGLAPSTPLLEIVLPVGISFYTFQTLSYTIDVYRGRQAAEPSVVNFALFVAWFPQLVAGPIERASRMLPQIRSPRRVGDEQWWGGAQLLLLGYLKKVAIADTLAPYVDQAFAAPERLDSVTLWLAVYAFAIQIYCDFSGYTDIARGTSRLFGIELMENFRQPYLSRNVTEFWRRWHVSLSTWLRDYLYIPLGGNRRGVARQRVNLMITMLLGGLWHGAAWTFVVWGGLHGAFLVVHRMLRGRHASDLPAPVGARQWTTQLVSIFVTFQMVCVAWVFFRAPDLGHALAYLRGLFALRAPADAFPPFHFGGIVDAVFAYGMLVLLIDVLTRRRRSDVPFSGSEPVWLRGLAYGIGLLLLSFFRSSSVAPFIYFQF